MLSVTARAPDGTDKVTVSVESAEKSESLLGEMDEASVDLQPSAWSDLDAQLDRRNDDLVVERQDEPTTEPWFAGRFDADERGGGEVTVTLASFEVDALDAEPTGGNIVYQNVRDSRIVEDLLAGIPTLEAGDVETLATNLSMSFSHAEPSKALRDVAEATGAELRYRYDRTVDYVDRRGSDREVVLSPANQNLVADINVTEDEREDVTHVRGFGGQSGPDQITADGVAPSYQDGERQTWREYENKDIIRKSRLQRIVNRLAAEYDGEPRHLEVGATVVGEQLHLGDRTPVSIPVHDVDRDLRVLERTHVLGTDDVGDVLGLTLSNRKATMKNEGLEATKDLQRFNRGYQGLVTRDTAPYGPEPVGDGNPREIVVPNWPDDVIREDTVDLIVQGDAWRSPIDPQPHAHDFEVLHPEHDHIMELQTTSESNDEYTTTVYVGGQANTVNSNGSWVTVDNEQISVDTAELYAYAVMYTQNSVDTLVQCRIQDSNINYYPGDWGVGSRIINAFDPTGVMVIAPTNFNGHNAEFQIKSQTSEDITVELNWFATGPHTHVVSESTTSSAELGTTESTTSSETVGADPRVVTSFDGTEYYPTDVEIRVNGAAITTLAGDPNGRWQEAVDLRGEFQPGDNVVAGDPATRGELNMIMSTELFREGRSDE